MNLSFARIPRKAKKARKDRIPRIPRNPRNPSCCMCVCAHRCMRVLVHASAIGMICIAFAIACITPEILLLLVM